MKIYFLVTEGVGENFVTIVSEKSLLEMFEQYYGSLETAEYHINRKFKWAVDMSKGSAKDIQTINLQNGHYYLCKSMAQVKSIKKREIRLQIEFLREQMDELYDMNIESRV